MTFLSGVHSLTVSIINYVETLKVQGVSSSPVLIFTHKGLSNSASFQNCRFVDSCGTAETCAPISLSMYPGVNSSIGNISFTVRCAFSAEFTLDDAIGSYACSLEAEANM
jgi:predicted flavoprotein YhiN